VKHFTGGLLALLLVGCTHSLHVAQYSDFGPTYVAFQKGSWVRASTEQFVVLGFAENTNFVDETYQKLKTACPDGVVQGIETQYTTDHGFFSWTNRVKMQGLCVRRG
jgi:hypothetical protein